MTRLEQLRLDRLLSPEQLAKETGLHADTIRDLEARRVERPRVSTLRALAEFFEVPPSQLLQPVPEAA